MTLEIAWSEHQPTGRILHTCCKRRCREAFSSVLSQARKLNPILTRGYDAAVDNTAVVHKKSWLEVCDRKHRYGANLRVYYEEWKRRGVAVDFWKWLDCESVEVDEIPRTKLEHETVLYCQTRDQREQFALDITDGLVTHKLSKELIDTGNDCWIFVLRDNILYASKKETKSSPRIHHTSFVGGECVQAAGMMIVHEGRVQVIYPHSGHYRPSENEILVLLKFLMRHNMTLDVIQVDIQRVQKIYRPHENGALVKKLANAHFWSASHLFSFLTVKSDSWNSCVFDDLLLTLARKKNMILESTCPCMRR